MSTVCERTREALSADLDDEQDSGEAAAAQDHLMHCQDCRRWYTTVAKIGRRLRVSAAPEGEPQTDLTDRVLSMIDLRTVCGCGDRCGCGDPCGCGDLCACRHKD
ncbi:hypothetical protein GCM10027289_17520 [Tsukamurella serpentis]